MGCKVMGIRLRLLTLRVRLSFYRERERERAIQVLGCEGEGLVRFLLHWVKLMGIDNIYRLYKLA